MYRAEEGGGDEPYLIVIGFRSTVGRSGTTRTFLNRYRNDEWAENLQTGRGANVPASMGVLDFPDVTLTTAGLAFRANARALRRSVPPEILGAVILAMDSDGSPLERIDRLVNKLRRELHTQLQDVIEDITFADLNDPGALQTRFEEAGEKVRDAMKLSTIQTIQEWGSALTDPDDLIGVYTIGMIAMDVEGLSYISLPERQDLRLGILGSSASLLRPFNVVLSDDNPRVDRRVRYDLSVSVVNVPR